MQKSLQTELLGAMIAPFQHKPRWKWHPAEHGELFAYITSIWIEGGAVRFSAVGPAQDNHEGWLRHYRVLTGGQPICGR